MHRRRRRRLLTRAVPVAAVAALGVAAGVVLAVGSGTSDRAVVIRYVRDYQRGDYPAMYHLLDRASRRSISERAFVAAYRHADQTTTLQSVRVLRLGNEINHTFPVRMRVQTKLFGALSEVLNVPLSNLGPTVSIRYNRMLLFPGLRYDERLGRKVTLAARGTLLASNGTPLAEGPTRTSPIPSVAVQIVGTLGPIDGAQKASYAAEGYPPSAQVGQDGLERIFQTQLAGKPGGELRAGRRVLARVAAVPGKTVKTTINPALEQAAVSALGNQFAGLVVMNPKTGALTALAGIAFSSVQPPGSTMKIVTVSAALTAGITKLTTSYPVSSSATINGYTLQNAGGESCGGTLLNAFAVSCNSVFAPLGAQLGGPKLVAMAEKFGFNEAPSIPGALESTLPSARSIGDALAVGSSAIGQGVVQASPLEMTDVAATIADGGKRPVPTLLADQPPRFVPVISRHVAAEVQQMMVAVVQFGTGVPAQIPGVEVAGKTGTAELRTTAGPGAGSNGSSSANTDAWFVAYAPVGSPKYVVGALFPANGAGAATAAPAVRQVLVTALASH